MPNVLNKDFCSGCDRRCCSRPVVLPEEKEAIAKAARMGFLERRRLFERRGHYYILRGETCPMLKDGKCSVEEVRPLNCRIFPLALEHTGKDAEWALSPECPSYREVPHEFVEAAKEAARPLLERHRKRGALT
jgi:Fe-S-cluster containining protein